MTDFDVPGLLNELEKAGTNNAKVAKNLNVCRSTVWKWKHGKDMTLGNWKRLLELREKIIAPVAYKETTCSDS